MAVIDQARNLDAVFGVLGLLSQLPCLPTWVDGSVDLIMCPGLMRPISVCFCTDETQPCNHVNKRGVAQPQTPVRISTSPAASADPEYS